MKFFESCGLIKTTLRKGRSFKISTSTFPYVSTNLFRFKGYFSVLLLEHPQSFINLNVLKFRLQIYI